MTQAGIGQVYTSLSICGCQRVTREKRLYAHAHTAVSTPCLPGLGGLSSSYGGLTSPGFSYGMSSFQPGFGSAGGSNTFSRTTKAVVVKKIETRDGKLVSESSDVVSK